MNRTLYVCLVVFVCNAVFAIPERGLVESPTAQNRLLMVGVPHGLSGIDLDLKMVGAIAAHPAYKFTPTQLWSGQATVSKVAEQLESESAKVDKHGTFFFYYSGHGSSGSIYVQDRSMKIAEIRKAIEKGRASLGPLARLVLMFDSCYSGSLLDPLRRGLDPIIAQAEADAFTENLVEELSQSNRDSAYWKTLFVFASSRANETSGSTSSGSTFTLALKKAYDKVLAENGTMASWVEQTKVFTKGHHPVERFVPLDINNEKMIP